MRNTRLIFDTACHLFAILLICSTAQAQEQQAERILETTGVRGGLVVHIGCGDGKLTAALRANDSYIVHGLDRSSENVAKARQYIGSLNLCGKVSVNRLTSDYLPYVDNLVNLVVAGNLGSIPMDEVIRVLAPNGVAYVRTGGKWKKTVKDWPDEIDEWTHFLHDSTGNAVAKDSLVGPPRHIQWIAEPVWSRNHHTLASISGVVSAQGRMFYIVDEGPASSMEVQPKWSLTARDAFNGVLLWKRPISSWAWHRRKFRSGPVQLPRTFVAEGDRVYAALGLEAPLTALDAVTGEVVRTYEGTEGTEEIILNDGVLLIVTGGPVPEHAPKDAAQRRGTAFPNEKIIVAIQADTGELLWKWSEPPGGNLVPLTLAALGERVFFQAGAGVICLDRKTGDERWHCSVADGSEQVKAEGRKKRKPQAARSMGWSVATLVAYGDMVFWTDGKRLLALSAKNGESLWNCPAKVGFRSPVDVLVANGLVWIGPDFAVGRDPRTGEVKKNNIAVEDVWTVGHHHRCYREKATDKYLLTGKRGIEFLDLTSDNHWRNNWIRGVCQYGIMPCNGLIYAPSHACGCFMEAKLYGFWSLAPERKIRKPSSAVQLEKGPAYGKLNTEDSKLKNPNDWPTYRGDPLRSGSTLMKVPSQLTRAWTASIGGKISPPVIAYGNVIVSAIDEHRVIALDAATGQRKWAFTAGGRVDSPPTIYRGLVLFGAADGWIYCLHLHDGQLSWRFRVAPQELNTVALGQVESVWPVHGSVLVEDGVAYAAAGRSSYIDGGIVLYGLDPITGEAIYKEHVRNPHPKVTSGAAKPQIELTKIDQNATDGKTFTAPDKSDAFSMEGATTDILVSDGSSIFMRHLKFNRECVRQQGFGRHLFSTSRLLDDAENHRSHWVLGTGDFSRIGVAYSWIANRRGGRKDVHLAVPYGILLAFDDNTVWGVSRGKAYTLFAEAHKPFSAGEKSLPDFRKIEDDAGERWKWSVELGTRPRAMVRAGDLLFLGGTPYVADKVDLSATFEGGKGGLLLVMSASNGEKLTEHTLDSPPVWDGMAAANGRLYISLATGSVLSLKRK
ncbi:MAG: outer membrane protein assembly factor BamB family protein, partial [Planctomycetota bacterium]